VGYYLKGLTIKNWNINLKNKFVKFNLDDNF